MSSIEAISIKVVNPPSLPIDGLSGNADALLHEVAALLDDFINRGQTAAIDLRSLPLTPADYALLRDTLANGEVAAQLSITGDTRVHETRFPGVWWVTHYNESGDVVAELLEIAAVPEILKAQAEDIRAGLGRLREHLTND